jgi:hypothetical protein
MKKSNVFMYAAAGSVVLTVLLILRNINYPQAVVEICHLVFDYGVGFLGVFSRFNNILKAWSVYGLLFKMASILAGIGIGTLVTVIFKRRISEGTAGVYYNVGKVIRCGLGYLLLTTILTMMFISSVVGIILAELIVIISVIFVLLGSIPFCVAFGGYLQKLYNGNCRNTTVNFIIGFLAVCLCCNIYGFAGAAMLYFYPVMSIGSFLVLIRNYIMHIHYDADIIGFEKEHFDRNKIRDIITKDIE